MTPAKQSPIGLRIVLELYPDGLLKSSIALWAGAVLKLDPVKRVLGLPVLVPSLLGGSSRVSLAGAVVPPGELLSARPSKAKGGAGGKPGTL